jgi:TRAP-type C4-dicarboxylate transport system permease small subunit
VKRLLRELDANLERYLMLVCYTFCCTVIAQEVIRRFVLNYSSAWAEETARYAFIYLGWIGAAYAVKERAHIRFDILQNRCPERLHGWIFLAGEAATIVFAVIALYFTAHTIELLYRFGGATPVLRVSKIWAEAAVPIGFILIVIRSVQAMSRDIADMRAGRPVYKGKALFED